MGSEIPTVTTERLVLRGHRPDDYLACQALWADPLVTRYIGGRPAAPDEVWSKILRYAGLWSLLGYGYWLIADRQDGRFIGEVGLADFKRAIDPPIDGIPEAGWALVPSAHGKGLATEAVRAALDWHESRFGRQRVVCMIDPENAPSIRVAEKCAFVETVRTTYKGTPTIMYERV